MKGFTPRERNGLIALSTVVLLCLLAGFIGPVSCSTGSAPDAAELARFGGSSDTPAATPDSSAKSDSTASRSRRDSKRSRRKGERSDSVAGSKSRSRAGKKSASKKSTSRPASPPRSLRDEHL